MTLVVQHRCTWFALVPTLIAQLVGRREPVDRRALGHVRFARFAELRALYEVFAEGGTPALPEPGLQYADYAVWQSRRVAPGTDVHRRQLTYWCERLAANAPGLRLPFARQATGPLGPADGARTVPIPDEVHARVAALCRRARVTPFNLAPPSWPPGPAPNSWLRRVFRRRSRAAT